MAACAANPPGSSLPPIEPSWRTLTDRRLGPMSRRSLVVTVVLAFAVLCSFAPNSGASGQPRTHDRFFLRRTLGGGWFGNKREGVGGTARFSGFSGDADIAIGGMVSPNLALHGTTFGWAAMDPDLELTPGGSGTANGIATMNAFGGGL